MPCLAGGVLDHHHRAKRSTALLLDSSVISDDAVPAAERPKNVAPGASPGYRNPPTLSPEGAKDAAATLSPLPGAGFNADTNPGLAPGATFLSRSAAKNPDSHFVANRLCS